MPHSSRSIHTLRRAFPGMLCAVLLPFFRTAAGEAPHALTPGRVTDDHHYEPVPGKAVGVWPDRWDAGHLGILRLRYGLNLVMLTDTSQYAWAIAAGFKPDSIMVSVEPNNYEPIVDGFPAGFYYVDEPVEHNCAGQPSQGRFHPPADLGARKSYIASHRPGARFVISGYKRCSHFIIAVDSADLAMYSSYVAWNNLGLPVCQVNLGWGDARETVWLESSSDQRSSWTDMRSTFGTKFSMSWVYGAGDEFDLLLGHATNLGLNTLWLFYRPFSVAPINPDTLELFCAAAANSQWLRRVEGPPQLVQLSPIEWNRQFGVVTLTWTTTSEVICAGFSVSRRDAGNATFDSVGYVPGHGTMVGTNNYTFTDSTAPQSNVWYRLTMADENGGSTVLDSVYVFADAIGPSDGSGETTFFLQNYPNPFNPKTAIRYQLSAVGELRLSVYDVLGREVATLVNERKAPGSYDVTFDASGLGSGVYFYRLTAGSTVITRRMTLVR